MPPAVLAFADPSAALRVAAYAGLTPSGVTRLPSETSAVFRLEGAGVVVRLAPPDVSTSALQAHLDRASVLGAAGVRFVQPARLTPLGLEGLRATLWCDLGPSAGVDYAALGRTVRSLQEVGSSALVDAGLPHTEDTAALQAALLDLGRRGLVTAPELDTLLPWVGYSARALRELPPAGPVVCHDDLWEKNVVQRRYGAWLLDPDSLAWGRPDYDLAFLTRAREAGLVSPAQVSAFESGYGAALPGRDVAWVYARLHRLRWMVSLFARRPWLSSAARVLEQELPTWGRPPSG